MGNSQLTSMAVKLTLQTTIFFPLVETPGPSPTFSVWTWLLNVSLGMLLTTHGTRGPSSLQFEGFVVPVLVGSAAGAPA